MTFHSNGPKNMKNCIKTLKTEWVKKLSLLYQTQNVRSIFTAFLRHCYWMYPSANITKWKTCIFFQLSSVQKTWTKDVNVASWNLWNHIRSTSLQAFQHRLATSIPSICDHKPLFYIWARNGRNGSPTNSSVTKWSLPNTIFYISSGLLEKI